MSETEKQTVSKEPPERLSEAAMPFAEGLQCLVGFSEALSKIHPSGDRHGAAAPMIILTSTGLELRFNTRDQAQGAAYEPAGSERDEPSAPKQERSQPLSGLRRIVEARQDAGIVPARLAKIEQELKTLRESTAALRELHETVAKDSRSIENTLESHSAAIGSVRAALSQNEELVEGIVETLQMLHGISADQSDDLAEELPVA
jgi:hypothetical protein